MNRWSALAVLLAVTGALALRAPKLSVRPLHNDEAVNALKAAELWQHGRYAYDPDEYHGPVLHYATLPFLWLSGSRDAAHLNDATLRFAPVAFGVGLILLLLLFADGLGRHAIAWAALFIAVSPAMVFYSRYFIHEMSLVFFTALTLGAGWRYVQARSSQLACSVSPLSGGSREGREAPAGLESEQRPPSALSIPAFLEGRRKSAGLWATMAGAGVGLMYATKETFVIAVAAMGAAVTATAWWDRRREPTVAGTSSDPGGNQLKAWIPKWPHIGLGLLAAFVVWLLFFSSFFTNPGGLVDSFRTYLPWLKRAGGHSPHIHPWNFYLQRLAWFHPAKSPVWSEGLILMLAIVGAGVSLFGRKSSLHRFLALYTIVLTAAYSAISYKTPWCLLSFLHGFILLAGIGAATVVEFFRAHAMKAIAVIVLLACTVQLTWQSWRASFVFPADRRNPYAYAQTVPDILNLVQKTEGIAAVAPAGYNTVVKVIAPGGDYWPLPWYLRRFKNLGWYDQLPADPFAPIMVVASKLDARLDEKSDKRWIMVGLFEMRPGIFFELYVELELWKKYVMTLPREGD